MRLDKVSRDALSIGFATGVYAVSFGVLSVAAGLSVAQTCVLSLLTFTGASQFSFVSVIAAGGAVSAALPPALLLAARNGVYALSLKRVLRHRAVEAHFVIDETTAMAHAQEVPADKHRAFVRTGASVFLFWNAGTLIGALVGGGIDPRDFGLDALFPAVFLALLAPQLRRAGAPAAAVAGALVAVALLPLTPAGVPVMASAVVGVAVLARRRA
jgi:4-azaleucine resistance transporter AzlC